MQTTNSIRLVIVDDNASYRAALGALLAQIGGVTLVGQSETAEHALELVAQLQPELVLVDVVLPGINGFALTTRLKELAAPPRVIVLTMHNLESYRAAALAAGADDFLAKDRVVEQLHQTIQRLFPVSPHTNGAGPAPDNHQP